MEEKTLRVVVVDHDDAAPIDQFEEHPRNNRRGDIAAIRESIEKNGLFRSIVVNRRSNHILAGNHTHRVAKDLGYETIPVDYVDVDDAEAVRILLADNQTSDRGTVDPERTYHTLQFVRQSVGSIRGTGFSDDDYNRFARYDEPFQPRTDPDYSNDPVTQEDVEDAENDAGASRGGRLLYPVLCPHCGEKFFIDEIPEPVQSQHAGD